MGVSSRAEHTVQGTPQSHVIIALLLWAADLALGLPAGIRAVGTLARGSLLRSHLPPGKDCFLKDVIKEPR